MRGRKKTMLLTVIAVATLLVAVVGATFAYFSLSVTNNDGTSTATVKTGKVPTITMENKNKNLYLSVSTEDMSESNQEKFYFAKTTDCPGESSCNEKADADTPDTYYRDIFTLGIAGSDSDVKYKCTGTLKVSAIEDEWSSIAEQVQPGDLTIGVKDYDDAGSSQTLDMVALKTAGYSKDFNISYNITGDDTKTIKAYIMLKNTDQEQQDYFANKTFKINITADSMTCTPTTGD